MGIKSFCHVFAAKAAPTVGASLLANLAHEPTIDELAREPNRFNILKAHQKINKKGRKILYKYTTSNPFLQYYYKIFL
jgi:hypothetical protein